MNKLAEFYTVVTDAGRELVAQATQAGEKVNITHFAVGDGGGSAVTPDQSQTQLVNECWRGLVATYSQQGDSLIIDTYIPPDEGNFTIREMGVFTADGVLFAVCNTPEMRKVLPSEGAVGSFVFGMELDITNIDMRYIEIQTNPELDFIPNSEKGQPNGVATLDKHGNVKELPELNFDAAGSAATVQQNLNTHIANRQNPHGVTAAQVGAISLNDKATLQEVQAGLMDNKWVTPYTLENSISLRSPKLTLLESNSISLTNYGTLTTNLNVSVLSKYNRLLLKMNITNIGTTGLSLIIKETNSPNTAEFFRFSSDIYGSSKLFECYLSLGEYSKQNSGGESLVYYSDIDTGSNWKYNMRANNNSNLVLGYVGVSYAVDGQNVRFDWKIYGIENSF